MATGATVYTKMTKEGRNKETCDAGLLPQFPFKKETWIMWWNCIYQCTSPFSVLRLPFYIHNTPNNVPCLPKPPYSIYCMLYLVNSKGGPLRVQRAKAVGNKEHFIKNIPIYIYIWVLFLKLELSTAAQPLLTSFNLNVPPCYSHTGLWSFKSYYYGTYASFKLNKSF